jgi:hypothetical protein
MYQETNSVHQIVIGDDWKINSLKTSEHFVDGCYYMVYSIILQ